MSKPQHIYALFDHKHEAVAAYHEVQDAGCESDHCSATVHESHLDESALTREERGREGARKGAVIGGVAGATIGGLILITVETDDPEPEKTCEAIFEKHGATRSWSSRARARPGSGRGCDQGDEPPRRGKPPNPRAAPRNQT